MPNYWTCGYCGASVEVSDKHCGSCSRRNDFPEQVDRSKLPTQEGPEVDQTTLWGQPDDPDNDRSGYSSDT